MKKVFALALAALCVIGLCASCGNSGASVSTDGSTSMEKVIGALGESFTAQNSNITFTYNPTGSGSGIKAVEAGTCDIGLSSRDLKDEEKASGLTGTVLAYDGIAMIVNNENPIEDLTLEKVAAIYTGEITNWSEVGGNDAQIVLIGREAGSGTRDHHRNCGKMPVQTGADLHRRRHHHGFPESGCHRLCVPGSNRRQCAYPEDRRRNAHGRICEIRRVRHPASVPPRDKDGCGSLRCGTEILRLRNLRRSSTDHSEGWRGTCKLNKAKA